MLTDGQWTAASPSASDMRGDASGAVNRERRLPFPAPVAARLQRLYDAVLERRSTVVLAVCVGLTLVGGALACAHLGGKIRFYDEREYLAIGRHIADDGTIQIYDGFNTAFRTPGSPLVLAAVRVVGLGQRPARFLNFLFLALTVVAAYVLARTLAGRAA